VKLKAERRMLERELAQLKAQMAAVNAADLAGSAREIGGVKVLVAQVEGDLQEQADKLRDQLGSALVVLASVADDKVQVLVAASRDIAGSRVNAGNLLKELVPLVGGRGGGRPDMARGGGSDASGIPALLDRAHAMAAEALG
jgi:alanyl-tRNA synthetase